MTDNMKKRSSLKRVYRLSFRRGKRAFAFALDAAAFSAVLLLALYITVRPYFRNRTAAVIAVLFAFAEILLVFLAVDKFRYNRYVTRFRKGAAREAAENKMLLHPEKVWESIPDSPSVFVSRSLEGVTADELLKALCTKKAPVTLVSLSGLTSSAERIAEAAGEAVRAVSPSDIGLDPAVMYPVSEDEIDRHILKKHADLLKRPSFRRELFRIESAGALKYLAVGGGLMLMSFAVGHSLYYRAAASISLGIGGYALFAGSLFKRTKRPGIEAETH